MPYQVKLSSDESLIEQINQDLAGRGFLFWRKFNVSLTNKRLHAYNKFLISESQKIFDLANIDSVYYEKNLMEFGLLSWVWGPSCW